MDNKQLLIDYFSLDVTKSTLIQEGLSSTGRMKVVGKIQEANVKNGNGRVYPREVLIREIQRYQEHINNRTSLGELDHPESTIINLNNVSHLMTKVWWDGDVVMGELELLNTPSGKIAQEIVANKIPLGISSRALGSVKQIGESVEVQDDLDLLCWDLVSTPSTPKAFVQLAESLNNIKINTSKYQKVNSLITEIICNKTGVCALC